MIFGIIIMLIVLLGLIISRIITIRNWNDGICKSCNNGVYKATASDSSGGIMYKCSNCESSWWSNGYIKFPDIKNPRAYIRSKRIKKVKQHK